MLAVARQFHMDPSHFSRVVSGKIRPSPPTCIALAAAFGDPPQVALHPAGWLDLQAMGDDTATRTLAGLFQHDAGLRRLCQIYASQPTAEAQQTLVRTVETIFASPDSVAQASR